MTKVFVTGIGIITALGQNLEENTQKLRTSESGINKSFFFQSKHINNFCFGEVPYSNSQLLKICNSENIKGITRTDALAFIAFQQAIKDAKLNYEDISSRTTAFISASTVGGMCAHNQLYSDAYLPAKPSDFLYSYRYAAHTLKIIEKHKIKGITNTINTACSSSANAIIMGAKLIKSKRAKIAIVGGSDSLSKYTVNGFNSLKILSEKACKPFDENRCGLSLGEGAAYIILEAEESIKNKYACISGYSNLSDTFHQSSLSEDASGVYATMQNAIAKANLKPSNIDYINTHGTATENNDKVELLGLSKVFKKIPPYNSTKSYTGHTLAAAGVVEAVFSIMSIHNSELYKSLNCDIPITAFNIPPIDKYINNIPIHNVLSNSFGFAGNCTSLVFSKI